MQCVVNGEKNMIYIRFPLSLFTSKQLSWLQPWKKICWWLQWSLDSSLILFDVKKMMTFNSKHSLLSPSNQIMLLSTKNTTQNETTTTRIAYSSDKSIKCFKTREQKGKRERECVVCTICILDCSSFDNSKTVCALALLSLHTTEHNSRRKKPRQTLNSSAALTHTITQGYTFRLHFPFSIPLPLFSLSATVTSHDICMCVCTEK